MFEQEYIKVLSAPRAIQVGEIEFNDVEVADDDESIKRGLMNRDRIPLDACMLFKFDDDAVRSFWMKNCRFPIVVLFLDKDMKVVSWHRMKVEDGPEYRSYSSHVPARYAIEFMDDGFDYGIHVGTKAIMIA